MRHTELLDSDYQNFTLFGVGEWDILVLYDTGYEDIICITGVEYCRNLPERRAFKLHEDQFSTTFLMEPDRHISGVLDWVDSFTVDTN